MSRIAANSRQSLTAKLAPFDQGTYGRKNFTVRASTDSGRTCERLSRKPAHRRPARLPPLGAKDGPLSTSRSEPATRVRRMADDNRCRWNAQHCELLADLIAEPPPREARPVIAFPVLPRHHEEPPKAKSPFLSPCREHVRRGTFVWDAGLRGV